MLQVLVLDQTYVLSVHCTSVASVLSPMETMLHLLYRHCSLPPVKTAALYLLVLLLTSCADCCSLPPEQTAAPYLLCRHYSIFIASGPE
nr:hypothetical protein [Tanacetum cinerariifolium]